MNHTSTLVVMFSALLCASMLRPTTAQDPVEANEPHLVDVMTAGDNFTGGAVFRAWSDGTIDYRVSDSTHCRDMGDVRVLLGPAGRAESTCGR